MVNALKNLGKTQRVWILKQNLKYLSATLPISNSSLIQDPASFSKPKIRFWRFLGWLDNESFLYYYPPLFSHALHDLCFHMHYSFDFNFWISSLNAWIRLGLCLYLPDSSIVFNSVNFRWSEFQTWPNVLWFHVLRLSWQEYIFLLRHQVEPSTWLTSQESLTTSSQELSFNHKASKRNGRPSL